VVFDPAQCCHTSDEVGFDSANQEVGFGAAVGGMISLGGAKLKEVKAGLKDWYNGTNQRGHGKGRKDHGAEV